MSRRALLFALTRVAGWLIVPLYIAGACAYYFLIISAVSWDDDAVVDNVAGVMLGVGFGAFAVVGALLVVRRPTNAIGWILAAIGLMVSIFNAGGGYATFVMVTRGRPDALAVFGAWAANSYWFLMLALALIYLPLLFPDGRLLSRGWLPVAVLGGIATLGFVLPNALVDTLPVSEVPGRGIANPIGIEALGKIEDLPIFVAIEGLFLVAAVGAVASVVVRFRRSRGVERQQMKLFAYVIVVLIGSSLLAGFGSDVTGVRWLGRVSFVLSMIGLMCLPIAVGIAILRYRLYDIDIIINRTLVYAPLTATLALMYFGGVATTQLVFRALTGQQQQPQLAIVSSTLVIAALFNLFLCEPDGVRSREASRSTIIAPVADDQGRKFGNRGFQERRSYEPRLALRRVQSAIVALVIITVVGILGYMVFEGWSFADALYMTVITLTTAGYREVRVLDASGQLWTMLLLITGVGMLFYAAVSSVELVVEGTVRSYLGRRRVKTAIGRLDGHYILCGYGRVGRQVAREFAVDEVPFVIVEQDQDVLEECLAEGNLALLGEASDDEVLEEAGILHAGGLIAAVDSDAENVFVVLSARKLNPKLHIVARASSEESAAKLEIAGADRTFSPDVVGGRRLASLATQPLVVDFLDVVTRGEQGMEFRLVEFSVTEDSTIAGHTVEELKSGEKTGAIVLAVRTAEGNFDTTPSADNRLRAGDTLIVLGSRGEIERLEQLMRGEEVAEG